MFAKIGAPPRRRASTQPRLPAPASSTIFFYLQHHYCFAIFNLIFLPFYFARQRKRLNCPSHLWSQNNAQTNPPAGPSTIKEAGKDPAQVIVPQKPEPPKPLEPVVKAPSTPLKPVDPIQIPKENPNEERLKQLESPETAELIKTFEITDSLNGSGGSPKEKSPTPEPPVPVVSPIVAVKPQPVVAPTPPRKDPSPADPSSLFGPSPLSPPAPTKDIKEATTDFLAQEFGQPKKTSKRYTKSRQKNNHS